jgi:tetratricopeptide (TPR) repeat protein
VTTWAIVLAYISLRRERFSWLPVILGVIALFTNFLAIVFLPALAAYCYWGLRRRAPEPRVLPIFGGLTMLAAMVLYFALGWQRGTDVLLPLFPTPAWTGAVFTLRQFTDLLNTMAYTCGPLLALFALAFGTAQVNHNPTERMLLLLLVVFPLAALIMHNPQLGMARDWDIAASLLVFIPVLGLILWKELNLSRAARQWVLGLCALWLVLLTTPAIGVQSSEAMTLHRFRNLLSLDPDRSETGWDYLSSHYLRRGQMEDWGRCNLELVKQSGNPRYHTNLVLYNAFKCQWPEAREQLQAALSTILADSVTSNWEKQITDPTNLLQLAQRYTNEFREQDAAKTLALAVELAPYSIEPRVRLLNLLVSMRDLTRAESVANEIAQHDSAQTVIAANLLRDLARETDASKRASAFLSLSLIADAASDRPTALRSAQSALKALPTDPTAQNLVARFGLAN